MRRSRTLALCAVLFSALLAAAPCALAKKPKAGAKAETATAQPGGEKLELFGSVAVGLDKIFIKDRSGNYFLVRGTDLSRFAGRHIRATGVVLGQERDYRVVRLLQFSIQSPDDDSPGATAATPARARK